MIYGILAGTERGVLLIMSESVVTIRDWVDQEHPDLEGLRIFRPHEIIDLDTKVACSTEATQSPQLTGKHLVDHCWCAKHK